MTENAAYGRPFGRLNPQALSPDDLARLLTAAGPAQITIDMIQADIAAGAPTNPDGTLHLVHYVAWLIKELGRGT